MSSRTKYGTKKEIGVPPNADPELEAITAAWPRLPDHIRATIQTLIQVALPGDASRHD